MQNARKIEKNERLKRNDKGQEGTGTEAWQGETE